MIHGHTLSLDDLALPDAIKNMLASILRKAKQDIGQGAELHMMYFVCSSDQGNLSVVVPQIDNSTSDEEITAQKARAVGIVRKKAATSNADLVIAMSEAWMQPQPMTVEEYQQARASNAPGDMPGAVEVLLFTIYHESMAYSGMAPIERNGKQSRLGHFKFGALGGALSTQGILERLLPPPSRLREIHEARSKLAAAVQTRAYDPKHPAVMTMYEAMDEFMWEHLDVQFTDTALATALAELEALIAQGQ